MIRAVMFDFGGVITSSPFEAFSRFEEEHGLPPDFIRTVNATNPDTNAWARLERNEVDADTFVELWSAEALMLGHEVDARLVLQCLTGSVRPEMVAAISTCHDAGLKTACLTNNFGSAGTAHSPEATAIYALFDAVLESRVLGVRKPDPHFYELACEAVGVLPSEAVFLDDLGINLKPARAMGMHTIKVVETQQALEELRTVTGLSFGKRRQTPATTPIEAYLGEVGGPIVTWSRTRLSAIPLRLGHWALTRLLSEQPLLLLD